MVTRVPSAANIDAYSQPAAPLPMTMSDSRARPIYRMLS
jgi:hypothetical protein